MKRSIVLSIIFFSFSALFAQTEKAKAMYAEVTSGKVDVEELMQRDFADVDSTSMHDLAVLLYRNNDLKSAGKCWEVALGKVKKHGKAYEQILNCLSAVYMDYPDIKKTEWLMNVIEEHNQQELLKDCNDYKCKLERAQYFMTKGDEVKSKECVMQALKLCENDVQKLEVEEKYAIILFNISDYEGAAQYYLSAANRCKTLGKTDKYIMDIYNSALNYMLVGKYDIAVKYSGEACNLLEKDMSEEGRIKYINALICMGDAFFCERKLEEAHAVYKKELDICSQVMPNTEKHADALEDIGKTEVRLKRFDDAKRHLQMASDMYDKLNLTSKHSNTYSELIVCLRKAGNDTLADEMENKVIDKRRNEYMKLLNSELPILDNAEKFLGSSVYTNSLNTVANCYYGLGNYEKAAHYFGMYTESLRDMLHEKFLMLSENDRKRVWEEQQRNIDEYHYNIAELPDSSSNCMKLFIPILYDMELVSKGIMLNSVIEFDKVLEEMGDSELIDIYKIIKNNQKHIQELMSADYDDNNQKILNLKNENTALSMKLMEGCSEFRDYTKYISYTWRDVQKYLGEDDIAIEFTTVALSPLDNRNYIIALILKSSGEPTVEVVSTKEIIKKLDSKEDLYDNGNYYNLFWGFMKEHLNGKKRVYFAPDNNLSNIAIEYLSDGEQTFYEKYEVYRLSSTKELCRKYSKNKDKKSITIFGNIDYDTELVAEKKSSTFGNLLYGKEEIKGIKSYMNKNYDVEIFERKNATEREFRNLSHNNPTIIHISSHGKYEGDEKTSENDAMSYSLLALAGANNWAEDMSNDGILSAADISQMNLHKCDMAVLSACNTGVGAKGDDGIFGLQRGFKNAGVHTLLMSLKPVYDESTAKLMVAFYKGIVEGKSKRESLLFAQKTLKAMGYTEGKYWAPFILLDALDKQSEN